MHFGAYHQTTNPLLKDWAFNTHLRERALYNPSHEKNSGSIPNNSQKDCSSSDWPQPLLPLCAWCWVIGNEPKRSECTACKARQPGFIYNLYPLSAIEDLCRLQSLKTPLESGPVRKIIRINKSLVAGVMQGTADLIDRCTHWDQLIYSAMREKCTDRVNLWRFHLVGSLLKLISLSRYNILWIIWYSNI